MKKLLPLLCALLLMTAACTRVDAPQTTQTSAETTGTSETTAATTAPNGVPVPSEQVIEKTYTADDAAKTQLLRVALRVPAFPGAEGAWAQVDQYCADRLDELTALCELDVLEQARARLRESAEAGTQFESGEVDASYEIARCDARVLSVLRRVTRGEGGDVREQTILPETFSMENGGKMSLYDLFPGEEGAFMPKLTELVLGGLKLQSAVQLSRDFEQNAMARLQPTDFVLTETGLTLWWQSGTISEGQPAFVSLPYASLDGLLDARWLPEGVQ